MALGVVLTPYGKIPGGYPPAGITYSRKGSTEFLCSGDYLDPQFNSRGEAGYYYDTPLGAPSKPGWFTRMRARAAARKLGLRDIPTDFDLAKVRGYLPVQAGWVTTEQGYQTGPWLPPHGEYPPNPSRQVVPLAGLQGLREGEPATTEDVIAAMMAHNDRIFALSLVSTTAVAVSALITVFRTLRLVREGK